MSYQRKTTMTHRRYSGGSVSVRVKLAPEVYASFTSINDALARAGQKPISRGLAVSLGLSELLVDTVVRPENVIERIKRLTARPSRRALEARVRELEATVEELLK
jgi:hypothetical protein